MFVKEGIKRTPLIVALAILVVAAALKLIFTASPGRHSIDGADYVGKLVLVGLTFENAKEGWTEYHQVHGRITSITAGFLNIKKEDGDTFLLPFNPDELFRAKPGEYCEKSTSKIIDDPDFVTTWTVDNSKRALIPARVRYGFGDFEQDEESNRVRSTPQVK